MLVNVMAHFSASISADLDDVCVTPPGVGTSSRVAAMKWLRLRRLGMGSMLLPALSGCGADDTPRAGTWTPPAVELAGAQQVSGSRLTARAWVSEAGPPISSPRFWDNELGEECTFRASEDGALRCLPTETAGWPFHQLYADASCNEPVVEVPSDPALRPQFISFISDACPGTERLYELGEELGAEARIGPDCVFRLQENPGMTVVRRGAAVDPARFVRGAEVVSQVDGAVALRQLTAEDGTARAVGLRDAAIDRDCRAYPTPSGWRCVTEPARGQWYWYGHGYYDGVNCMSEILAAGPCEQPAYGLGVDSASAGGGASGTHETVYRVYDLAPADALPANASAGLAACLEEARAYLGEDLYLHEGETDYTSFPELVPIPRADGVISGTWLGSPGGAILLGDEENMADLFDTRHEVRCALTRAADGEMRCLPSEAFASGAGYYADDRCREGLVSKVSAGESRFAFGEARNRDSDELVGVAVHEPGEDFSGPVWTKVYGGPEVECRPAEASFELLTLGAEIPASDFTRYDFVDQ